MSTPNKPIQIAGCQRSGTTLIKLILDSHPLIKCIDETEFTNSRLTEYLEHPNYHPNVVFKLPTYSHGIHSFSLVPDLKVIWCIRDPRDVVLSMVNLKMNFGNLYPLSWANHPDGAAQEIRNCSAVLGFAELDKSSAVLDLFKKIEGKHPAVRNRNDAIYAGALCWKLKHELLPLYDENKIPYIALRYEDLVTDPGPVITGLLEFLDIPWHDNVLKHHQLQQGRSVGNTVNTRAIDRASIGKWKAILEPGELSVIQQLCADTALKFNYRLAD